VVFKIFIEYYDDIDSTNLFTFTNTSTKNSLSCTVYLFKLKFDNPGLVRDMDMNKGFFVMSLYPFNNNNNNLLVLVLTCNRYSTSTFILQIN